MAITDRPSLSPLQVDFSVDNHPLLTPMTRQNIEELQQENREREIFNECSRNLKHMPGQGTLVLGDYALSPKYGTYSNIRKGMLINGNEIQNVALASPRLRANNKTVSYRNEEGHLRSIGADHLLENRVFFDVNGKEGYYEPYLSGGNVAEFKKNNCNSVNYGPQILKIISLAAQDLKTRFHDHGLIHRDVKPANIMLNGDRAILVDYGFVTAAPVPIKTKRKVGTPSYMAPECFESKYSKASDIYALGMTLCRCLEVDGIANKLTNPTGVFNLLTDMCDRKVGYRPSIEEVIRRINPLVKELESPTIDQLFEKLDALDAIL